jgi:hypothetical protein
MLIVSYDSRSADNIYELLFYFRILGTDVIRLNLSNIQKHDRTITDVLRDNPSIKSLALGIGISNDVLGNDHLYLYNCQNPYEITIHLIPKYSPTVPLPKNTKILIIDLSASRATGKQISEYLFEIVVKDCQPFLSITRFDNVSDWTGFFLPAKIQKLTIDCRRNIDSNFMRVIELQGFRRTERNELCSVFEKTTNGNQL